MESPHSLNNKQTKWLREAVIYSLDIRTFKDSNNDGCGDISGLISRLNYLKELGVSCIWLAPFYISPERDGGYDIVDHCAIDPKLGSAADFDQLIAVCHQLDIRIIIDLVFNHTSNQHEWFRSSLKEHPVYSDWYIWQKKRPYNHNAHVIFAGIENSNWHLEPVKDAYYYHSFYAHEPDLNATNTHVQQALASILRFWAAKGVDGFRIDATPHILRKKGRFRFKKNPFHLLHDWRQILRQYGDDKVLVGETDVDPDDYKQFLKDRSGLNALFNFYLNNYLFHALAAEKARSIKKALRDLGKKTSFSKLLNFIRNHDELDLDRLTEKERKLVQNRFAPDKDMIIYKGGLRRRVAPMFHNNHRRIKLSFSLLVSLPGIPVLRYGDEIGMGEDLALPERLSVRTIMQWSDQANGGFSGIASGILQYPIIGDGTFGYKQVNVARQKQDPESLLSCMKSLLESRRRHILYFTEGLFRVADNKQEAILACFYDLDGTKLLILHNLSPDIVEFPLNNYKNSAMYILEKSAPTVQLHYPVLVLSAYAYCWLRIEEA